MRKRRASGYDARMAPRVVILGCGFGGLFAARALARAPVQVTVVDRTNHHLFQPLLYQVATAALAAPDIAAPIRRLLRHQKNTTVLMGDVTRIAAGRMGVDLQYKIDKGALLGENKVELANFTLGERIEAPGALNLPLDLAGALLTDSDGPIALAVPVKGNVNEPEFSYGHVIWQAITTVLTNIVTAPFRALFGGGNEVESIAFDPGRAALLLPRLACPFDVHRVLDRLGLVPEHLPDRHHQNLEIEPDRPVVDVLEIQPHPVMEIPHVIAAADLPETRQPRLHA